MTPDSPCTGMWTMMIDTAVDITRTCNTSTLFNVTDRYSLPLLRFLG